MEPTEGEAVKNKLTGMVFLIKRFRNRFAVLETEDGSTQVLTEKDNLRLFYDKMAEMKQ